jgi:hypothetical protein
MSPQPSGPLQPPGQEQEAPQQSAVGGGFPSPQPAVPNPNEMGQRLVTDLVTAARRLGIKYPQMMPEIREITQNLAPKMLQKLVQSQPSPEPLAPPV